MSCDCYKIGGPWITFDPDCPAHGLTAQSEAKEREEADRAKDQLILRLEGRIQALEEIVADLKRRTSSLVRFK